MSLSHAVRGHSARRSSAASADTASDPRHVQAARMILRIAEALSIALIVVVLALAAIWRADGGSFFNIRTASMGTVAPVGSLVIDRPLGQRLHVGELISFNPPGSTEVFTHRIYRIRSDGLIQTKGDVNGAPDGWMLPRSAILGRVDLTIRYIGWLAQTLPIIIIGALLVWLFAQHAVTPECRITVRACGMLVVAVVALLSTHALMNADVISFSKMHSKVGGAGGTVIGTGLLPVDVQAIGGTAKTVTDGQVAQVWTGWHNDRGDFALHISPHWAVWWIAPLVLLSLIPALIGLSLPRREGGDGVLLSMVPPNSALALTVRGAPGAASNRSLRPRSVEAARIPELMLEGKVADARGMPRSRSAAARRRTTEQRAR